MTIYFDYTIIGHVKNNVIQLHNVLPILCKFFKFTQFTVIQIKNYYIKENH